MKQRLDAIIAGAGAAFAQSWWRSLWWRTAKPTVRAIADEAAAEAVLYLLELQKITPRDAIDALASIDSVYSGIRTVPEHAGGGRR